MTKAVASLHPATRTSSANGTGVDTLGFDNACLVVNVGDIDTASGDETYTVSVEESADNSTFTAITGASTTMTADNTLKKIQINGLGSGSRKRYLRAVFTLAGTTPSMPGTAVFHLGPAHFAPQQAPDVSV